MSVMRSWAKSCGKDAQKSMKRNATETHTVGSGRKRDWDSIDTVHLNPDTL